MSTVASGGWWSWYFFSSIRLSRRCYLLYHHYVYFENLQRLMLNKKQDRPFKAEEARQWGKVKNESTKLKSWILDEGVLSRGRQNSAVWAVLLWLSGGPPWRNTGDGSQELKGLDPGARHCLWPTYAHQPPSNT